MRILPRAAAGAGVICAKHFILPGQCNAVRVFRGMNGLRVARRAVVFLAAGIVIDVKVSTVFLRRGFLGDRVRSRRNGLRLKGFWMPMAIQLAIEHARNVLLRQHVVNHVKASGLVAVGHDQTQLPGVGVAAASEPHGFARTIRLHE